MSDNLPNVWSADQHTVAKHKILQAYLQAWLPILARSAFASRLKYIDGFAGPGVYEKGEKGSPILALEAALNHSHQFPAPVELVFIEAKQERFDELSRQLFPYNGQIAASRNICRVLPVHGECCDVIDRMLAETKSRREKFGPSLCFLDQFGYSAIPMDLIRRILQHEQCEVLSFFFWRDLGRFITDTTKHAGISTAFGGEEWRPAIEMNAQARQRFMQDTYIKCLHDRAAAKYVWQFSMTDTNSNTLCWLFFCTNSIRGLEEMKKAMWTVDQTGEFSFSDAHGLDQLCLLTAYDDARLEADIRKSLMGRKMTLAEIKEWVLTQTPAYRFKQALANLEKAGLLRVPRAAAKRRSGSFPDEHPDMIIEFENSTLF